MEAAIVAIGTANPIYKQDQQTAAELIAVLLNLNTVEKKLLKTLYRFTGIQTRHSVLSDFCKTPEDCNFFPNNSNDPFPSTALRMKIYKENALALSLAAINDCISSLHDFDLQTITHLITVSCTGMYAPGLDIELLQTLNLPSSTKRTAINFMGCYGAFNGIKVAESICRADPHAKVLVICVEICTIHFQKKTDLDNLTSNAIFADGAACALIQSQPQHQKSFTLKSFYCDLLPQSSKEMAWHIGDSGFDMVLTSYVPEAISKGIALFLQKLLQQTQLVPEDIDYYAIHPGAQKILKACEKALNISEEKNKYSYNVLRHYGNMSSPTVLFVLKEIWMDITDPSQDQKNIFSCAFGPGLTLESMVLQTNYA